MPPAIWARPDACDQLLDLAKSPVLRHALHVGGQLTNGLHVGRKPGKPVSRALLAVEPLTHDAAVDVNARTDFAGGVGEQCLERAGGVASQRDQMSTIRVGRMHREPRRMDRRFHVATLCCTAQDRI
jgi:hypothetical protein